MPYTLDRVGGDCPTQAYGRLTDDRPFYFRARHGTWTLHVGEPGWPTDYADWPIPDEWNGGDLPYEVASGDDPTGGFMPDDEVRALLDAHLAGAA